MTSSSKPPAPENILGIFVFREDQSQPASVLYINPPPHRFQPSSTSLWFVCSAAVLRRARRQLSARSVLSLARCLCVYLRCRRLLFPVPFRLRFGLSIGGTLRGALGFSDVGNRVVTSMNYALLKFRVRVVHSFSVVFLYWFYVFS
ncbi:hypothetical protein NL676_022319 [Syzygium grande]|nr:hypothetical protein NL676_022319 [Syzygium grande]